MKRFIALLALAASLTSCSVMMQGSRDGVSVGAAVNISAQPPWGPAGYACAPYYYFPDFNIYYDVNRALFYYHSYGRWVSAHKLPPDVGPHDFYKFYKVVLDVRDPWLYNRAHRSKYRKYRGIHTQPVLRDAPGYKHNPRPAAPPQRPRRESATPYRDRDDAVRGMRNNNVRPDYGQGSRRNNFTQPPKQQKQQKASSQRPRKEQQSSRANGDVKASGKRSTGSRGR